MTRFATLLVVLAAALAVAPARAQPADERVVRIVVPYAAGGITDTFARLFATSLAAAGQKAVVDNRPGGNTAVGADILARAAPDGTTVGVIGLNAPWIRSAAADGDAAGAFRAFTPIAMLAESVWLVVVPASSEAKTFREWVDLARASPSRYNYGSGGFGTFGHLSMASIQARAGLAMQHVPYKGESEVVPALLRGDVAIASLSTPTALEHVRSGRLRAIASTGRTRSSAFPDLPTVGEVLPGADQTGFFGLFGPANLPPAATAKLNAAVESMMASPEMRQRLVLFDSTHPAQSPDAFGDYLRAALAYWASLVRQGGLALD